MSDQEQAVIPADLHDSWIKRFGGTGRENIILRQQCDYYTTVPDVLRWVAQIDTRSPLEVAADEAERRHILAGVQELERNGGRIPAHWNSWNRPTRVLTANILLASAAVCGLIVWLTRPRERRKHKETLLPHNQFIAPGYECANTDRRKRADA